MLCDDGMFEKMDSKVGKEQKKYLYKSKGPPVEGLLKRVNKRGSRASAAVTWWWWSILSFHVEGNPAVKKIAASPKKSEKTVQLI